MQEIICTSALVKAAGLEVQESTRALEAWAADAFPFKRQHMLLFLHLPTQYFTICGPLTKKELNAIHARFKECLWSALNTDGFSSDLIDDLMARFEHVRPQTGTLEPQHQQIFETLQKGFLLYAKAVGESLDLDEFAVQVRNVKGTEFAALSPQDTFLLWAQSTRGDGSN